MLDPESRLTLLTTALLDYFLPDPWKINLKTTASLLIGVSLAEEGYSYQVLLPSLS
jgi:hypothetical protein